MIPFDRTVRLGLSSGHNSSGPSGPEPGSDPGRGFLRLPEPIICQECQRPIGGTTVRVSVYRRTRADYSELRPGELGAWCIHCKRLTVYSPTEVS